MIVPITTENEKKCLCGTCNTFKYNGLMGSLFCARGKSEKTPLKKGCECAGCPVFAEYKLDDLYFCIRGAAE